MRKSILIGLSIIFVMPILAHEFWLQLEKFIYQPGENINIRFWVGEDYEGSNWAGNHEKINSLQLWLDNITYDIANQVTDEKGDSLQLSILDEGTPMVTFNSTNSYIFLEAEKFNAYLKEDGLASTAEYRAAHNETDSAGREFYQRSVKTLLQVGEKKSNISHPTGLPLDIIPLKNPYAAKDGDSIAVSILYRKQPLLNQLVNVWHRVNGKTVRQEYLTKNNGKISFAVDRSGKWMLSTVKMERLINDPKADWQSYWGSCTWGYE